MKANNNNNQNGSIPSFDKSKRLSLKKIAAIGASGYASMLATGCSLPLHAASPQTIGHSIFGTGEAKVIVLHDWSVDVQSDYQMVRSFIDKSKFTLAFADVRGYGGSKDMAGEFSAVEISRDVATLADSLGWDKFSIVGHSMTGMAVQRVMVDMPERLISVVAAVPIPASGLPVDDETFAFFESMATDDESFKGGMSALTSGRYGDSWASYKLAENRATVSAEAMKAYATMWSKTDFSAQADGNQTPILVIYGAHDSEALRQDAAGVMYRSWYANLEEHVCQSGHYPMIETPVDYIEIVQSYLLKMHYGESPKA